jgi:hypothetical protein
LRKIKELPAGTLPGVLFGLVGACRRPENPLIIQGIDAIKTTGAEPLKE